MEDCGTLFDNSNSQYSPNLTTLGGIVNEKQTAHNSQCHLIPTSCMITILSNLLQYYAIQYRTMQNIFILFNAMQIKLI